VEIQKEQEVVPVVATALKEPVQGTVAPKQAPVSVPQVGKSHDPRK
jgi:hypothetical protein